MQKLIIHGGCGAREDQNTSFGDYHQHLIPIIEKGHIKLAIDHLV